ncbi:hypothetical protein ACWGB8_25350 [Kitasatospora sp. NPDC054939]
MAQIGYGEVRGMAGGSSGNSGAGGAEFTIKPWEVHGEGREFEKISADWARAAAALEQKLAALGTPWGLDRPGSAFAAAYREAQGSLLGGLNGLGGRLGHVGAGLHAMAERTADADTTAAAGFGAVATPGTPRAVPGSTAV